MASTKKLIPATVVTPYKVQRDRKVQQARLLNRSGSNSSLLSCNHDDGHNANNNRMGYTAPSSSSNELCSPQKPTQQSQQRASSHAPRVFRCLSNTPAATSSRSNNSSTFAVSPEIRGSCSPSSSGVNGLSRRAALKHMFQPPTTLSGVRHPRSPLPQKHNKSKAQQKPTAVQAALGNVVQSSTFFGSRLDRSTLRHAVLRPSKPIVAPKESNQDDDIKTEATDNNNNKEEDHIIIENGKKKVHFRPIVSVVAIPSHRDYASSIKRSLWSSMKEIKANAIRNTAEFLHDRCNWRKATEEDRMYRDSRSGAYIHPVHVQRYYAACQKAQEEKKKRQEQKEKDEQEEKRGQAQQQEEQESSGDNQENQKVVPSQVDRDTAEEEKEQQPPVVEAEHQEKARISLKKRVRCCSPSPIRRSSSSIMQDHHHRRYQEDYERQEYKRQRIHFHPQHHNSGCGSPCRGPVYYSQQPQPTSVVCSYGGAGGGGYQSMQQQYHQQENCSYGYEYYQPQYEYDPRQQQYVMMQPSSSCPGAFPHHPSMGFPPPTTEIV